MSQSASIIVETSQASVDRAPLPDGWRWVRLDEVCSFGSGRFLSRSGIKEKGSVPVYGANGVIGYTDVACFSKPQIVIGRVGSCGAINVTTGEAWITDNTITCAAKDAVNFDYLASFLQSVNFDSLRTAAIQPLITQSTLKKIWLPLPPISIQQRIAFVLNKQMSAVERARAAAEVQLKAAKDLPIAYLRAVFENEEAQGWSRKQLNELGELLPAKSIATKGDTQVTAITTACLTESGFQPLGVKTARMSGNDAELCKVSYGEILLARSNTSELVGRAAMFSGEPENAIASDLTIRFLPYSLDFSPFLAAYLSFLYTTGYWKERAGGASDSMKKITRPQVLQLSVPVPSAMIQSKVVGELSEQMQSSKRLVSALSKQLNDIKQLPAALLRQAFTGKL